MNKAKRSRRAGATDTFSVSVDPVTKRALRQLADRDYGGNLSALVSDFAEEARRRMAAARYLERHGISALTPSEATGLEAELAGEATVWLQRRKRRTIA